MNNQQDHLLDTALSLHKGMGSSWINFNHRFLKVFPMKKLQRESCLILPIERQIKAWRKANRKMGWGINEKEFTDVHEPPAITESDRKIGYIGTVLFYGFGDDGSGNSNAVLSGKLAWEYARKQWWTETWKCEYIDFERSDNIRLRPGAPSRPKGFYFAKFRSICSRSRSLRSVLHTL